VCSVNIKYDEAALFTLRDEMQEFTDAVKITLGPRGKTVMVDLGGRPLVASGDGRTVAREVMPPGSYDAGSLLLQEVGERTGQVAGDGSTTSIVLANALFREGVRAIVAGCHCATLVKGMKKAVSSAVCELNRISKPAIGKTVLAQVGATASGSREIGESVATAWSEVGKEGTVTVGRARGSGLSADEREGLCLRGSTSSNRFIPSRFVAESQFDEAKARVESAVRSVGAALLEGVVPGGGVAYLNAARVLADLEPGDADETGFRTVRRALEEPLRQIAANAGWDGSVVVGKVRQAEDADTGFDAEKGVIRNLADAGIVDATTVTRVALETASSICGLLLKTGTLVSVGLLETDCTPTPE
jgi:chaperonin GroEL (HSP60 family)